VIGAPADRMRYPRALFVDSSALYAFMSPRDSGHRLVAPILNGVPSSTRIVLTNLVRAEVQGLCTRHGPRVVDRVLDWIEKGDNVELIHVTPEIEEQAIALVRRYRDHLFSITDAASFLVMEQRGVGMAVALDAHIRQYGHFQVLPAV
jgi:hypothetical protein